MKIFTKKSGFTLLEIFRLNPSGARARAKSLTGFTLVEIMIVVGIIAILAGIFLVGSSRFRNAANVARVKADLQKFEALQEIYYTVHGEYAASKDALLGETPKSPATSITYRTDKTQSCADGVTAIGMDPDPYCLTR